jgi:hypothetical protein
MEVSSFGADRCALRDDQWDKIKGVLTGEGHVGVTAKDNRLFVEAVIYRYAPAFPGGTSVPS